MTATAVLALMLGLGAAPALAQDNSAQTPMALLQTLFKRQGDLSNEGKYEEALAAAEEAAKTAEQIETAQGKPGRLTSLTLNSVIWNALLARQFDRALKASDRAATAASTRSDASFLFIRSNRAYALMFTDHAKEALALFVEYKGEPLGKTGKWEDVIAEDFGKFRKAGLDNPLMKRASEAMAAAPDSPYLLMIQALEQNKASQSAEALSTLEKYGQAVKTRRGEDHPDYAEYLRTRGKFLKAAARFAEAEQPLRRALAIDEKAFGAEHVNLLPDLSELSSLMSIMNRPTDAEPLMRRVLAVAESAYGPEHLVVGVYVTNLALLLQETDRLAEAEPLLRRALAIDEKARGPEHPNVAVLLNTLAVLSLKTGRFAEA
jgi:hypothetical protein